VLLSETSGTGVHVLGLCVHVPHDIPDSEGSIQGRSPRKESNYLVLWVLGLLRRAGLELIAYYKSRVRGSPTGSLPPFAVLNLLPPSAVP
jgi:hypothetical protein